MPTWERSILLERAGHFLPALIPNPDAWPKREQAVPDAAFLPGGDYAMISQGGGE